MRIKPLAEKDYSLFSRFMFWLQRRKQGKTLLPTQIWARSPKLYFSFSTFYLSIIRKASPIKPTTRALVMTLTSQLNNCAFCTDINRSTLEKLHIAEAKIIALHDYMTNDLFDAEEKIALAYTEAITLSTQTVTDALFNELKKHYDDNAIVELTAIISFQNLSSKFNGALDIPAQGFCRINNDLQSV